MEGRVETRARNSLADITRANPKNHDRGMPSATFSLRPHHIDAIREAAINMQLSQSEIVRKALDLALQEYALQTPAPNGAAPKQRDRLQGSTALVPLTKELAAIRRELNDLKHVVARLPEVRAHDDAASDLA